MLRILPLISYSNQCKTMEFIKIKKLRHRRLVFIKNWLSSTIQPPRVCESVIINDEVINYRKNSRLDQLCADPVPLDFSIFWTRRRKLTTKTYGLKLSKSIQFQYSFFWHLECWWLFVIVPKISRFISHLPINTCHRFA